MKKSRFSTEQIIGFIKQGDAGMEAEDAKRLKEVESENTRLKRLLAEAHLDIEVLKIGFGVKRQPRNASARRSDACSTRRS